MIPPSLFFIQLTNSQDRLPYMTILPYIDGKELSDKKLKQIFLHHSINNTKARMAMLKHNS